MSDSMELSSANQSSIQDGKDASNPGSAVIYASDPVTAQQMLKAAN